MDLFEYLVAVPAIILGLGITHLVMFFGNLLVLRSEVKMDVIHLAWVLMTFILHIQVFYVLWGLRRMENWQAEQILSVTFLISLVAVSARVIAPSFELRPVKDLAVYFEEVRVPFFGLLLTVQLGQMLGRIVFFGDRILEFETLMEVLWMFASIFGLLVSSRLAHYLLLVFWSSVFVVWFFFAKINI